MFTWFHSVVHSLIPNLTPFLVERKEFKQLNYFHLKYSFFSFSLYLFTFKLAFDPLFFSPSNWFTRFIGWSIDLMPFEIFGVIFNTKSCDYQLNYSKKRLSLFHLVLYWMSSTPGCCKQTATTTIKKLMI